MMLRKKISQSCWSLLSKLYLSRNWLQSRPPATGNDQGHGSRQDLQTSHSDTATTHKNTNSNMNMTLNYNHKGSYMIIHEICHDRRSWNFFQVLSSPRAESARAVTGRQNSHRWEGGRLFEPSAGFFYGNSCNSGTKSRKIVSKVGN